MIDDGSSHSSNCVNRYLLLSRCGNCRPGVATACPSCLPRANGLGGNCRSGVATACPSCLPHANGLGGNCMPSWSGNCMFFVLATCKWSLGGNCRPGVATACPSSLPRRANGL